MKTLLRNLATWVLLLVPMHTLPAQVPTENGFVGPYVEVRDHDQVRASNSSQLQVAWQKLFGIWAYDATGFDEPSPDGKENIAWRDRGHLVIIRGSLPQFTGFKFSPRYPAGRRFILDVLEHQDRILVDFINIENYSRTPGILRISEDGEKARVVVNSPPDGSKGKRPVEFEPQAKTEGMSIMTLRRVSSH